VTVKAVPTVTTTIHNAAEATVTSVSLGSTVHDSVAVTGGVGTPTGTVTFDFFNNGTCTVQPRLRHLRLPWPWLCGWDDFYPDTCVCRKLFLQAVYSGDSNYAPGTGTLRTADGG